MGSGRGWLRLTLLVALLQIVGAPQLSGEWLVTNDGRRIETRGSWEVRGKTVVFTLPNGTLGSLRLDYVDLEASQAGEQAGKAEEAAEPDTEERRAPALVLTDADFPSQRGRARPEAAVAEDGEPEEAAADTGSSRVAVSQWQRRDKSDELGFAISGSVRNGGSYMAIDIAVSILLYDEAGQLLTTRAARVLTGSLAPGESAQFTADFDALDSVYDRVEIEVSSFDFVMGDDEPANVQDK